jgi:hypothetical protein
MCARKFLMGILALSGLFAPLAAHAQTYGYSVDKQWQKVLRIDSKKEGVYRWFGYPVDNFGILTAYRPPIGKQFKDTDRICATWSCLEIPDPPPDSESLLELGGFADLAPGGSVPLTPRQQKSLATGLLLPQLAKLLGIKGKIHWSRGVQASLTAGKIWKRFANLNAYNQFIDHKSTNLLLTEGWGRGELIYIGADIVAQDVTVILTVDPQTNASANAALEKAAFDLSNSNSSALTLRNQGNGSFVLKISTYFVLAVQVHHQCFLDDLRSDEKQVAKQEKNFVALTSVIPAPRFNPKTLQPVP